MNHAAIDHQAERRQQADDAFMAALEQHGHEWVRDWLVDGSGPLALVLDDDDRMETLQISSAYFTGSEFDAEKYGARDASGNLLYTQGVLLTRHYRVDMQDLVTYRQAATIAKQYGQEVDTTGIDRLIELVARRDLESKLMDGEFLERLYKAMRESCYE